MSDVRTYFVNPATLVEKTVTRNASITLKGKDNTTRTRKLITYDVPEIPDEEYEERFSITAEPVEDIEPSRPIRRFFKAKEYYQVVCTNEVVIKTVNPQNCLKNTVFYTTFDYEKAQCRAKEIRKCGLDVFIRTVKTDGVMLNRSLSFIFNSDFKKELHKIDTVTSKYTCMLDGGEIRDMDLHELNDYLATLIYEPKLSNVANDIKNFQITNKSNYKGKSAVTEYAIIDHVNTLDKKVSGPCYTEAYRTAIKHYKIPEERVYKMKEFCNKVATHKNWDKSDYGRGFKFKVRNRYNPSIVILICDNINNLSAKQAYNAWTKHGVKVEVIQANQFEKEHQFYSTNSKRRQTVANWAYACDWSLSAPLTRDVNINSLETYCKRTDAEDLRKAGEMHITKVSSRPESFLEQQRTVAPKAEVERLHSTAFACRRFALTHPHAIDKVFWRTDGFDVEEFFDIDKVKCPHCGKAMNPHNHKDANQRETEFVICTNCETRFSEDVFEVFDCKPYYEDNGDDNDSEFDA